MTIRKESAANLIRLLWMAACGALSILMILRGERTIGIGLLSGTVIGTISEIVRTRRRRKTIENGDVLYDERDLQIAGQAAIFTIRILMTSMALAMLAVVIIDAYWTPSILPAAGVLMGITALCYTISYKVMRRRDIREEIGNSTDETVPDFQKN